MTNAIRTPIGQMWIEDGVLWHRIDDAATVTEDDAAPVIDAVRSLTGGTPCPAIVDMRHISFATAAARREFGGPESDEMESATALIVRNTGSRLMAQAFLRLSRPRRPIEVFVDSRRAKEWAQQHRGA